MSKSISQTAKEINKYIDRIVKYIKNNPNSEATKKIVEAVKYIQSTPSSTPSTYETPLKPHTIRYDRPIPLGVSGGTTTNIITNGMMSTCCGGTLGCLVTKQGKYYILSNFHVLANDIIPGNNGKVSEVGDIIVQPGPLDYRCEAPLNNAVGKLSEWEPISTKQQNYIDAAIGEVINDTVRVDGYIEGLGIIKDSPVEPYIGMKVVKSGRTTGVTYGIIEGIDTNVIVTYDKECGSNQTYEAVFVNQILITPDTTRNTIFSASGDSGSLILREDDLSPVGLLFAGSGNYTQANRINMVLQRFGVSIVGLHQYVQPLQPQQPQTLCIDSNNDEYRKARDVMNTYLINIMSNFPYFRSAYVGKYNGKYKIIVMVDRGHIYELTHFPRNICGVDIDFIEVDKFRPL
jgi:hypothetical protein